MAYIKFENPETQRALEGAAENNPNGVFKVVRRWRLFGDKAIRGDLANLARLLRENEEFLRSRRGRFAILAETAEEKVELETSYRSLEGAWRTKD